MPDTNASDSERSITAGGIEWHVRVEGDGPPVLLLHGFTGNYRSWDALADSLRLTHTVVRPDLPGHGSTVVPFEVSEAGAMSVRPCTMQEAVNGLVEMMAVLNFPRFSIIGYSLGGRTALALSCEHPENVEKVVLESTSPGLETQAERAVRSAADYKLAAHIEAAGLEMFVEEWSAISLFASQQRLSEESRLRQRQIRLQQTPEGLAMSLRGMGTGAQRSYWNELRNMRAPVLLLTGEDDAKYCQIAKEMMMRFPNAVHRVVREAGHNVHMEQFDAYVLSVAEFLDGRGGRRE